MSESHVDTEAAVSEQSAYIAPEIKDLGRFVGHVKTQQNGLSCDCKCDCIVQCVDCGCS